MGREVTDIVETLRDALEEADAALNHVQAHLRHRKRPQDVVMNGARARIAGALLTLTMRENERREAENRDP
jgi:hypothetical protein